MNLSAAPVVTEITGNVASAGYLGGFITLLALAGVVLIAVRRWLRSPKE